MAVFLIVGNVNLKRRHLCTTFRRHTLRGGILLRQHRLQFQFAKLHVRTDTKQARSTFHQRVVRGEGNVTSLNQLDDFVLFAFIAQLQVLGIKVERGIGVVVQVHVHLVAHLTIDIQIDFLVKVNTLGLTVTLRQRGIVDVLQCGTQLQFCRTLRLDTYTTRTENLLSRSQVKVHIGKAELLLAFRGHILCIFLAEEGLTFFLLAPQAILLRCHQHRGIQIRVAQFRTYLIGVHRVVILYLLTDIRWQTQVKSG